MQRGNGRVAHLQGLHAILSVAEHGGKWRGCPSRFGRRQHPIYPRMKRWSKTGVLDRVGEYLQQEHLGRIKLAAVAMDRTIMKAHPDGTGARKTPVHSPLASLAGDGPPRFLWWPRTLARR